MSMTRMVRTIESERAIILRDTHWFWSICSEDIVLEDMTISLIDDLSCSLHSFHPAGKEDSGSDSPILAN